MVVLGLCNFGESQKIQSYRKKTVMGEVVRTLEIDVLSQPLLSHPDAQGALWHQVNAQRFNVPHM